MSRARRRLLVTAVDAPDDEGAPSRFLGELGEDVELKTAAPESSESAAAVLTAAETSEDVTRVLSMGSLLAELRAIEAEDAECVGHPRFKACDDATALLFR